MTNWEYRNRLHKLQTNALANVLYHQDRQAYWGKWDRRIRIALGVFTIVGVVLAFPDVFSVWVGWLGLGAAVLSAAAAIALSIVSIGDMSRIHGELFRLWSDLHADAAIAEQKTCDLDLNADASQEIRERLLEMVGKTERLCADEPKMEKALFQAYEEEARRAKGPGKDIQAATPSASDDALSSAAAAAPSR